VAASTITLPASRRLRGRSGALTLPIPAPELAALLVLAAVLYLWALDRNGLANEYYSAAVKAMTTSWHAFIYGSFDSSGVMTVDKPPLALWIQALSVRAFGLSSWSLLVPQALMGVATVALVYDLTRRRFGRLAGFVAGLALVLTPVTVAVARDNNPDALLALCCTAALWAVVRALEDGRTRWLVLAGVAVGLGFETKMAAALLVVPAIVVAWLRIAPRGRAAAIRQLFAGGAAMTVVALAWPLLMWLTPAAGRPWIAGTSDNSIWSLILGYNGLGRVFGQQGTPGLAGPGIGAVGVYGGHAGPTRLINATLGGQDGWLLGVALIGVAALLAVTRLRRSDPRTGWLLLVGGAFVTTGVAFSRAKGIFLPYYVAELAPLTAAMVGGATGVILGGGRVARLTGAATVALGVVTEIAVLRDNPPALAWWPPLLAAAGVLAAAALASELRPGVRTVAVAAGVALLLLAPGTWAVQTVGHALDGKLPAGGPVTTASTLVPRETPDWALPRAIGYARRHGGGAIAVASQSRAAVEILSSDANVVGIGGFSGRESQVTTAWLADEVHSGRIRWVLAPPVLAPDRSGRIGATEVMAAAEAIGMPVRRIPRLYDLQGLADELRLS
jgi:4-amino-4-deoxy-L-arabinose transferase-like glycosyltransferase